MVSCVTLFFGGGGGGQATFMMMQVPKAGRHVKSDAGVCQAAGVIATEAVAHGEGELLSLQGYTQRASQAAKLVLLSDCSWICTAQSGSQQPRSQQLGRQGTGC